MLDGARNTAQGKKTKQARSIALMVCLNDDVCVCECAYQFPVEHAHCTKANKKYTYMDTGKIHAVSMKYTAVAAVVQPFKSLNVCVQIESGCAVE